ncbi:unnamed protein product, partial [Mesorhabditis belari]|uniref:Domain of unknown function DB domain-containing protein n=1 Tax=Mesorhabditis belari TaxID=2138241 RepID=A0AAF3J2T8_9BILA
MFSIFYTILFLSAFLRVIPALELNILKAACPEDKDFCAQKAFQGECFGGELPAKVLRKECPCSCENAFNARIQNCCLAVGPVDTRFCLPLCLYNITAQELSSTLAFRCASQLPVWIYCLADGQDSTECCQAKEIPARCHQFCSARLLSCEWDEEDRLDECLLYMDQIINCHKDNLSPRAKFDQSWRSTCPNFSYQEN